MGWPKTGTGNEEMRNREMSHNNHRDADMFIRPGVGGDAYMQMFGYSPLKI